MSDGLPGWICTWVWSPPGVRPGPRAPASVRCATEAEARAKATELRANAARFGAMVAVSIAEEKPA